MFDFGCTINHYCSDMTRTFLGQAEQKTKENIWERVKSHGTRYEKDK